MCISGRCRMSRHQEYVCQWALQGEKAPGICVSVGDAG